MMKVETCDVRVPSKCRRTDIVVYYETDLCRKRHPVFGPCWNKFATTAEQMLLALGYNRSSTAIPSTERGNDDK